MEVQSTKSTALFTSATALSLLLSASIGQGSHRKPEPALAAVKTLQPALSERQARDLAGAFVRVAKRTDCGMPWQLLVSIAYHESSLRSGLINARSKDFGLMQVNRKNILRHGLSQAKLMTDVSYSIQYACSLLRDNHARYGKKVPYWLGLYRSGTALWKPEIAANAQRYDRMVRATARSLGYRN